MKRLMKFLIEWNELWTLPLALLLWWISPWLLHVLDPTAGTYDAGIFQIILFALIQFMVYHAMAWIFLKITFPGVYRYLDNVLEDKLKRRTDEVKPEKHFTEWQRAKASLFIFSLYLLCMVMLSRIV